MSLVTRAVTAHLDQITPVGSCCHDNALPDGIPRESVLPEGCEDRPVIIGA
jgi:hypothetical protein